MKIYQVHWNAFSPDSSRIKSRHALVSVSFPQSQCISNAGYKVLLLLYLDEKKEWQKYNSFVVYKLRFQHCLPTFIAWVGKLFVRRATFAKNVAAEGRTLSLQNRKVYSLCKKTHIHIKHSFFDFTLWCPGEACTPVKNPASSDGFNVRGSVERRLFLILTVLDLFY